MNLSDAKKLTHLTIWHTRVGETGLSFLSHFPQLTSLDVGDTTIGDANLEIISSLSHSRIYGSTALRSRIKGWRLCNNAPVYRNSARMTPKLMTMG